MSLSKKAIEKKKKYSIEYAKKHYKRIPLDVKIEEYDQILKASSKTGESVNGYIKNAIFKRIKEDKA